MRGPGFVFLASRPFPGPTVPRSSSLWLMSPCREVALSPAPGKAFCANRQQKAPEEQMFLFKADGNCRDHFSPHRVFKCKRQLFAKNTDPDSNEVRG